jgi:hypothetical protein|tara:strand:+ start:921 stop:1085 length:165 start_codon:yes stop_codon:yes gene_type:complete
MTKKTEKKGGSKKETTCGGKGRKTQVTANGNKKKGKNYDILPEEAEDDYMVWFW